MIYLVKPSKRALVGATNDTSARDYLAFGHRRPTDEQMKTLLVDEIDGKGCETHRPSAGK